MSFQIGFSDEPDIFEMYDDPTIAAAAGALILGESTEDFIATLYVWTREQYLAQWKQALLGLLNGGDRAMLLTEFNGLQDSRLWCWNLYLIDDVVYFQEKILFFEHLDRPFVVERAADFVQDRRTHNEEGQAISEWSVSRQAIQAQVDEWLSA